MTKPARAARNRRDKVRIEHIVCDLCKMDGYTKTAVAMYRDAEGEEWDVCLKHLRFAKKAGLEYQMLALAQLEPGAEEEGTG